MQPFESAMARPLLRSIAPVPIQVQIALAEPKILSKLSQLKQKIVALHQSSGRSAYEQMSQEYADQLRQLADIHRQRKQGRDRQRLHNQNHLQGTELERSLLTLQQQSQRDGIETQMAKTATR